jgi:hypothetical protein
MRHWKGRQFVRIGMIWLLGASFAASLPACSTSSEPEGPLTGTLSVRLVDAPAVIERLEKLELEFDSLWVHASGDAESSEGGWFDLLGADPDAERQKIDVLELIDGSSALLGEAALPVGRYTQLRLVIVGATVTIGGRLVELNTPSGTQTGVKLYHPFEISPDQRTTLVLDFDAQRSVYESPPGSGAYSLKPTIRVAVANETGSIAGQVLPFTAPAAVMAVENASADTVTTTIVDLTDGTYVLSALPEGTYDVSAWANGYAQKVVEGVVVRAGVETSDVDFVLMQEPTP